MFTVLLPPGGYPITVRYISYNHISYHINIEMLTLAARLHQYRCRT